MKKAALIFLTLILACLCACGSKAAFTEADLSLTVNGTAVTAETAVSDLLAAFGEDYAYAEAISCVFTGMDKTFTYDYATLYTYPDGDADRLMELYCVSGDVQTAKGITLGSTSDDIRDAYGAGTLETDGMIAYELPAGAENVPASLYFELDNGAVSAIGLTTEHRGE